MQNITGIHHIALKARGIEEYNKVVSFYKDILGLTEVRRWGENHSSAVMLCTGSGMLEIFANAETLPQESVIRHIAFSCNDVDLLIEKVKNAGYEITIEPKDIKIPSVPPFPARIAFCKGPLNEEIEFFCEK